MNAPLRDARTPATPSPHGMIWIDGGGFRMGSGRAVEVSGFFIDARPVTNRAFARFVDETGWVTFAELAPEAARGFTWRAPFGPGSSLGSPWDGPVAHVAWLDAQAYASWVGKSLPTEAEWEFAAQRGLQNMAGGVWEWTRDWWAVPSAQAKPGEVLRNPSGGRIAESCGGRDADLGIPRKVLKGGPGLFASASSRRARATARRAQPIDTSTAHVGFRCVLRPQAE